MNAQALLKRGAPAEYPHEISVASDESALLYDKRLTNPISEERIRNFVVMGQIQAITIRVNGNKADVVEGRQRWKMATVINHVAGVKLYKGPIKAIHDCIAMVEASDLAELIKAKYTHGMKLTFTVKRGDERSAALASIAANEMRDADPLELKIGKAQRLAGAGFSVDEIREAFGNGVTAETVRRWLATDIEKRKAEPRGKPGPKKGGVKRPGAKKMGAALAALEGSSEAVDCAAFMVLEWVSGKVTDARLAEEFPALKDALAAKPAKAAA